MTARARSVSFVAILAIAGFLSAWAFLSYRYAQADDVPHVGPAAAMLFDAGVAGPDLTPAPLQPQAAAPQPVAPPAPAVSSESTPEEVAAAAWWALRAGYLGPAALLLMFAAGAASLKRRGYIVKRWPRLNDGRVWAAVSIVTVAAGTLVPLALANDLTAKALYAAALGSLLLWVRSQLGGEPAKVVA